MQPATTTSLGILEKFGRVLSYPTESYFAEVEACRNAASEIDPEAARYLCDFSDQVCSSTVEEIQELYVQTFDLNPICALEVGWQLYGDNYDRGNFLVKMRQELARHGVPESVELPDHLCHVLPLIARMEPATVPGFVSASLVPALKEMLAAFEGKGSPYEKVLKALSPILELASSDSGQEANHV
ncbi:MAG: nitrate reductase molybdenum cofactor assembly chaperone [Acidobacteriota bacterium]